jgi:hypothetical protein
MPAICVRPVAHSIAKKFPRCTFHLATDNIPRRAAAGVWIEGLAEAVPTVEVIFRTVKVPTTSSRPVIACIITDIERWYTPARAADNLLSRAVDLSGELGDMSAAMDQGGVNEV